VADLPEQHYSGGLGKTLKVLLTGTLIIPLVSAILLILITADESLFGGALGFEDRFWTCVAITGPISFLTTFLVIWRFETKLTFHWLYWFGIVCLSLALFQILEGYGREYPWDPYNIRGYQVLALALSAVTTLVLGLLSIITAVIQDTIRLSLSHRT
jgi:hypothetical protein